MTKVGTNVEEDCQVQVVWKRGEKETQEGALVDLNNIEVDCELNDVFIKESSFYKSGEVWQPKMCEFQLKMVNEFGSSTYAQIQYDMCKHVNKESDFARITFESAQFEEVYIET